MANDGPEHWTLDKRIPLALIITIAIQTAGFAFYMGDLSARLSQTEKVLDSKTKDSDRLTRLEVQLENLRASILRIEQAVTK